MRRVLFLLLLAASATLCAAALRSIQSRHTTALTRPPAPGFHAGIDPRALATENGIVRLQQPKNVPSPAASRRKAAPASPSPASNADWLARVEHELAIREYDASVNAHGLQAPNRVQNLRTYFEPDGVRIVDRTAQGEPELVAIRVQSVGREGALAAVPAGALTHEKAHVELVRPGMTEWYENSPKGLEQGFTIEKKPAGDGPLLVELRVKGARPSVDGEAVRFACAGGRTIRYGGVAAVDADGARLPACLEIAEGCVRIVTTDADATYPVTIDPYVTSSADTKLSAFQANSQFGGRVASAGDVNGDGYQDILVSAGFYDAGETDEGAAFVFLGGPDGIATSATPATTIQSNQTQAFMGEGLGSGDFNGDGYSDIIVGAHNYSAGQTAEGAAFVFMGGPSGIPNGSPATAAATLQSNSVGATFGLDAMCAGDVNGDGYQDVIVGAGDYNGTGAAFLFLGSATGIHNGDPSNAATSLICNQVSSSFGYAVASAGDVNGDGYSDVIVGAYRYDGTLTNQGAAFIWLGGPSGIASGNQTTASGTLFVGIAGVEFGYAVAGAGDVNGDGYADVAVGTPFFSSGQASEGAVWLFLGQPTGIANNQSAASMIQSDQAGSGFGGPQTIAGGGDVNGDGYADVIIGAPNYDFGQTDEGSVFVVLGCSTGFLWTSAGGVVSQLQSDQVSAHLGNSVAFADVNGDGYADVIAGAYAYDGSAGTNEGQAFVYLGGARGITGGNQLTARATIESNQTGAGLAPELGFSVASAGDVNGDSFGDAIVGAPGYDLGEADEGAAFVFLGPLNASSSPATASATLQANQSGAHLGSSVAGAGDVNDDGYADVIVGAPDYAGSGEALIYDGAPSGIASGDPSTAATVLTSDRNPASMGSSVAGAGDVNADGFADVIVGAENYEQDNVTVGTGAAFVFLGGPTGVPSRTSAAARGHLYAGFTNAHFGHSVAGAGDVNGDGYADVIVGAPFYYQSQLEEGTAYIYEGGPGGITDFTTPTSDGLIESNEVGAHLGISVAGAGDVNGDGYDDVIVGADHYGANDAGAAFVWFGSVAGIPYGSPGNAARTFTNGIANSSFGASVAGAGDVNGDGYADVLVGATGVNSSSGNASLYPGSPAPPGAVVGLISAVTGNQAAAELGGSVAGVGDMDADGFADVLIGARLYDDGQTNEGAAFFYNGGGGLFGRQQLVQQFRGNGDGVPVQPWGLSYAADGFRAAMKASDPDGREKVKLEVEHCPDATPFGSGSCVHATSATWTEPTPVLATTQLPLDVGSVPAGPRRWRIRTLYAPENVTRPGITPPAHPAHGPWRRIEAQRLDSDLRIGALILAVEFRHDPNDASRLAIENLVNPTRGRISFSVVLPNDDPARAELFDVAGRRLLSRDLDVRGAARSEFQWDERARLSPGAYLLRLSQGGRVATAHLVVLQ